MLINGWICASGLFLGRANPKKRRRTNVEGPSPGNQPNPHWSLEVKETFLLPSWTSSCVAWREVKRASLPPAPLTLHLPSSTQRWSHLLTHRLGSGCGSWGGHRSWLWGLGESAGAEVNLGGGVWAGFHMWCWKSRGIQPLSVPPGFCLSVKLEPLTNLCWFCWSFWTHMRLCRSSCGTEGRCG